MNKRLVPEDAILIPEHAANVFKGEIFDTYQWDEKDFEGGTMRFEMVRRPDTVAVICIVDDKLVVLDEVQPHRGARRNFPGGRVDETDESIIAAAQREVHEETGYRFENWRLVKVYQPIAKMEWFIHTVVAWGEQGKDEPHRDAGEQITERLIDFDEVKRMVAAGEGYLFEAEDIFKQVNSIEDLQNLAEFSGRTLIS
jgi:8-oxo-dGTP pyrophosphatase MutT (NUDIX family)